LASKNSTFFLTTGSYFSILNGLLVLGLTYVLKKPVMAMLMSRTAIVRDFAASLLAQSHLQRTGTVDAKHGSRRGWCSRRGAMLTFFRHRGCVCRWER